MPGPYSSLVHELLIRDREFYFREVTLALSSLQTFGAKARAVLHLFSKEFIFTLFSFLFLPRFTEILFLPISLEMLIFIFYVSSPMREKLIFIQISRNIVFWDFLYCWFSLKFLNMS